MIGRLNSQGARLLSLRMRKLEDWNKRSMCGTIVATERLMEAALRHKVPYVVSISSSVVNSMAIDNYTETKKAQEALVAASEIKQVVLRPTLMFGWFDRKHVGWLARFMQRVPVFPIPGSEKFLRQPLYAADFCNVIVSSIMNEMTVLGRNESIISI